MKKGNPKREQTAKSGRRPVVCIVSSGNFSEENQHLLRASSKRILGREVQLVNRHYPDHKHDLMLIKIAKRPPAILILVVRSDEYDLFCDIKNRIAVMPKFNNTRVIEIFDQTPLIGSTPHVMHVGDDQVQLEICYRRQTPSRPS